MDKKIANEALRNYIPTIRTTEHTATKIKETNLGAAAEEGSRSTFSIEVCHPGDINTFMLTVYGAMADDPHLTSTSDDFEYLLKIGRQRVGIPTAGEELKNAKPLKPLITRKNKEEIFSIRIDEELKSKFAEVCLKTDKTQADVIRGAMRHYIMIHTQL